MAWPMMPNPRNATRMRHFPFEITTFGLDMRPAIRSRIWWDGVVAENSAITVGWSCNAPPGIPKRGESGPIVRTGSYLQTLIWGVFYGDPGTPAELAMN